MLTTVMAPDATYSVTRCTLADMSSALDGAYVHHKNANRFADKLDQVAHAEFCMMDYGGIRNVRDAVALMRDGWADGARQAGQLAPQLTHLVPPPKPTRRRVRWADTGSELHIDRAMRGEWGTAWRNTTRVNGAPRVLSLACNFGGSRHLSHAQLFWNAAQMIVVTDMLEHAGYAVELRAVKCNQMDANKRVLLDIEVKRADQPLRPDAVAAVFGHAGVYRSYGHTLLMCAPFAISSNLGVPINVGEQLARAASVGLCDAPDYVIEFAYTLDAAARNITQVLTALDPAGAE